MRKSAFCFFKQPTSFLIFIFTTLKMIPKKHQSTFPRLKPLWHGLGPTNLNLHCLSLILDRTTLQRLYTYLLAFKKHSATSFHAILYDLCKMLIAKCIPINAQNLHTCSSSATILFSDLPHLFFAKSIMGNTMPCGQ